MRIGLFFGSFNPIHLGHTRLAQYILTHSSLDEIWLVVSPNNPLKPANSLLDEHIRYELACKASADLRGIRATDFEFTLSKPNYTIVTLRALNEAYPEHQFSLIIGSDNLALFHRWRAADEILRDYPIIVYPREGDDIDSLARQYPAVTVIDGAPLLPISATQIRENMHSGDDCSNWLHPAVADFFKKNTNLFADIKKKM